uniref:Uncharacterized protein n=1 Tax=Rhizophora mucronata TaxID=61149 RepID=A0A2P2PKY0_RHIMU
MFPVFNSTRCLFCFHIWGNLQSSFVRLLVASLAISYFLNSHPTSLYLNVETNRKPSF